MEIKVSELTGFCYGVRQAIELATKTLSIEKRAFSIGPIIHNPQVVAKLKKDGLIPVDNLNRIKEGTIIIPSHGAGAYLLFRKDYMDNPHGGLKIIDATCPFVKKIREYVLSLFQDDYTVVIIGKKDHPEVKGLFELTDEKAIVLKDTEEAEHLDINGLKIGVVSQSTYSLETFREIISVLLRKPFVELRIFNTICRDTIRRQEIAKYLANDVDVIIVIGGRNSANTIRLVEVCKERLREVYHIEEGREINPDWFNGRKRVGIVSGASTPDWVVKDAISIIERINLCPDLIDKK